MNNGDSFNPDDMEINFRETIEFFADENNNYSKKDLHDAFLVVTRLYLDELISMRNWENLIANIQPDSKRRRHGHRHDGYSPGDHLFPVRSLRADDRRQSFC